MFELILKVTSIQGVALIFFLPLFLVLIFKIIKNKQISKIWRYLIFAYYFLALAVVVNLMLLFIWTSKTDGSAGLLLISSAVLNVPYCFFAIVIFFVSKKYLVK